MALIIDQNHFYKIIYINYPAPKADIAELIAELIPTPNNAAGVAVPAEAAPSIATVNIPAEAEAASATSQ